MLIRISKAALIHDVANMAFVIADIYAGRYEGHGLHQVTDICQEGNIDRVARVAGLAFAKASSALSAIVVPETKKRILDLSAEVHDYVLRLRVCDGRHIPGFVKTSTAIRIKETLHEYMVCMILADWLGVTLPEAAPEWKERAERCLSALASSGLGWYRRRLTPI